MFNIHVKGEKDQYQFLILFLLQFFFFFFFFFVFLEEKDIKVEQNYIFTLVFNRVG